MLAVSNSLKRILEAIPLARQKKNKKGYVITMAFGISWMQICIGFELELPLFFLYN